jgi:site-specific recombinase XerD
MKTNKRQSRKLPKILSRQDVKKLLAVPNVRCITGLRSRVIMQLLYRRRGFDAETISWIGGYPSATDYLFCSCHGKKLDQSYVRKVLYQASEKAGVYIQDVDKKKRVKPHCLRASLPNP